MLNSAIIKKDLNAKILEKQNIIQLFLHSNHFK